MKKHLLVVAGLSMFALASAGAQDLTSPKCTTANGPVQALNACQQAYDLYQFMSPQLGLALAGGNATLGVGSTLGGLGHFSVGIRVNAFQGSLPQADKFVTSSTGARPQSLPTSDQFLGLPTADAAIGILSGIPLGVTNVLGVDALVSAAYVPTFSSGTVSVKPSQSLQVGYGVRVGLLQESIVVPGVSVTYLKRDLPTTSIVGSSGSSTSTNTISLGINNLKVNTTAWRVVASKSLLLFSFAAGGGIDKYEQSADIAATVSNIVGIPGVTTATATVPGTSQSLQRNNYFFDAALNLPLFKIVAEAGQVSGGAVATYNSFNGGRADKSLQYFSAGIRVGL